METAAAVGDLRKPFRLMRSSSGKVQPTPSTFREGNDRLASGYEQKLKRGVEHFSQLLNCPPIELICVTSSDYVEQ